MDNKILYKSITTPQLDIEFRQYIVELMCLNINGKLKPYFWKDKKYWGPKFPRELKRIKQLSQQFDNFNDPLIRNSIINVIKTNYIKSLSFTRTFNRFIKLVNKEIEKQKNISNKYSQDEQKEIDVDNYIEKNIKQTSSNIKNKLSFLKEIENGQEK